MLDLNLLKILLYNTSSSRENNSCRTNNKSTEAFDRYRSRSTSRHSKTNHKIDIILTLETDTDLTELLLLHNLTDQDMTTIDQIHVRIVHHTDLHIDHHIDEIHILDIDHVHTLQIEIFHDTLRHIDLLLNHESLDLLDLDQVMKKKKNQYHSNRTINFEY